MCPMWTSRRRVVVAGAVMLITGLVTACSSSPPPSFGSGSPVVGPTLASPSATGSPETVLLPDLVGRSESTARRTLGRLGLVLVVAKRRATMDQPPGYVTGQGPSPFAYVPPGTTVRVNLALAANPWGYNFGCCQLIANPPSTFCSVFPCVATARGRAGNLLECADGRYARAMRTRGACQGHGGPWRWLLAPTG